jgi:hypothetical protein
MRPVEGTPGTEVFGEYHLVAILNFWAVPLRLFELTGDQARGGDDALGLWPLQAVFGAEIAREAAEGPKAASTRGSRMSPRDENGREEVICGLKI